MRLFFALTPEALAAASFASLQSRLAPSQGQRVAPENLHLTLAFVGEIHESRIGEVRALGAAQRAYRFALATDGLEYWAQSGVWVAVCHDVCCELADLAASLQQAVAPLRTAARDETVWRAHVTLARKVSQPPVFEAMSRIEWTARAFSLFKSERIGARSAYTVVDSWPLLDKSVR
jgi:2'-5' RNA ligase